MWLPHLLSAESLRPAVDLFSSAELKLEEAREVVIPFHESPISKVTIVKQFVSGHAPTLVCVEFGQESQMLVLKKDDLRSDYAVVSAMGCFNYLWALSNLRTRTKVFGVVPLTAEMGLMEFVKDSVPLNTWPVQESILTFSTQQLDDFLESSA
jgi:hypothetical protein